MKITPRPDERRWDIDVVDSMLYRNAFLPDGPGGLPLDDTPDPLRAIVSGITGSWHWGPALYCLWQWASQHSPHTRQWSAEWRFSLDGEQQGEAIRY